MCDARFDTRPKCLRRPCTCSDICISSSAQHAKPGILVRSPKYACSCQMQTQQPKTLHPTNRGNYLHTRCVGKFPYLLELGRCSLVKACMRGLASSARPQSRCGSITTYQNGLVWHETVTRPPRLCAAPQLLHTRHQSWLMYVSFALAPVTWSLQ